MPKVYKIVYCVMCSKTMRVSKPILVCENCVATKTKTETTNICYTNQTGEQMSYTVTFN